MGLEPFLERWGGEVIVSGPGQGARVISES
jgi:hypothetical protein